MEGITNGTTNCCTNSCTNSCTNGCSCGITSGCINGINNGCNDGCTNGITNGCTNCCTVFMSRDSFFESARICTCCWMLPQLRLASYVVSFGDYHKLMRLEEEHTAEIRRLDAVTERTRDRMVGNQMKATKRRLDRTDRIIERWALNAANEIRARRANVQSLIKTHENKIDVFKQLFFDPLVRQELTDSYVKDFLRGLATLHKQTEEMLRTHRVTRLFDMEIDGLRVNMRNNDGTQSVLFADGYHCHQPFVTISA